MKPKIALFAGPSLPTSISLPSEVNLFPPIKSGDIYSIINQGYTLIAILDGLFHGVPSVWHREILLALDEGIEVWGASSMGALRACELKQYGMKGFGNVFNWYSECLLDGDDEVALHHLAEAPYTPLTIPLVDIRNCLKLYLNLEIGSDLHEHIIKAARRVPYWDRLPQSLCSQLQNIGISDELASNLLHYLSTSNSVKQNDALVLIDAFASKNCYSSKDEAPILFPKAIYASSIDLYSSIALASRLPSNSIPSNLNPASSLSITQDTHAESSNLHAFVSFWIEQNKQIDLESNVIGLIKPGLANLLYSIESEPEQPSSLLTRSELSHFYFLSGYFQELQKVNSEYMNDDLIKCARHYVSSVATSNHVKPAFPSVLHYDKLTDLAFSLLAFEIFLSSLIFEFYRLDLSHLIGLYTQLTNDNHFGSHTSMLQRYLLIRFFGISVLGGSDSSKDSHHVRYVAFCNTMEVHNV